MASNKKQQLIRTAYHESGHAVVGFASGQAPRKVTIVPDKDALGYCAFSRRQPLKMDTYTYTNSGATRGAGERDIMISLAGWEAERLFTGRRSRATRGSRPSFAMRHLTLVLSTSMPWTPRLA